MGNAAVNANPVMTAHVQGVLSPASLRTPEAQDLLRILAGQPPQELISYLASLGWNTAYVIAAEWDYISGRTDLGRGDLVLSTSPNHNLSNIQFGCEYPHIPCEVLIIELKHLTQASGPNASEARRQARRTVERQVGHSVQAWRNRFPMDVIRNGVCCVYEGVQCTVEPPPSPIPAVHLGARAATEAPPGNGWASLIGGAVVAMGVIAVAAAAANRNGEEADEDEE